MLRVRLFLPLVSSVILLAACSAASATPPDKYKGMSVEQVVSVQESVLANLRSLISAATPAGDWTLSTEGGFTVPCGDTAETPSLSSTVQSNGAMYAAKPLDEGAWVSAIATMGALLSTEGYGEPTVRKTDDTAAAEYLDGGGNMIVLVNSPNNLTLHLVTGCYLLYGSNS